MKLYIKGLMLGSVLLAAGCTDLETDLNSVYTGLPDSPIVLDGQMNACYFDLHGWFGRDFIEGVVLQGDEILAGQFAGQYYDDGRIFDPNIHALHLDNYRTKIITGSMSGISKCNSVITAYGGPDKNDPGIAPVRAMRAYYHFWMMELYGDAPILDHVMEAGEALPDRSPRAAVARWIESELLEILNQEKGEGVPALSKANDASTYGRPNYWMAAALLAKLYLNWGVYTHDITTVDFNTPNEKLADCVKWCNEIISSGIFDVGTGYRQKFFPTTGNGPHNKDFIYALDTDPASKPDGCVQWYRFFIYRMYGLCRPLQLSFDATVGTDIHLAGVYAISKEALKRFTLPNDERNEIIQQGPQFQYDINYNRTNTPVELYKDPAKPNTKVGQLEFIADFMFENAKLMDYGKDSEPAVSKTSIANGTALLNSRKGARLYKYPPREQDYGMWKMAQANDNPIFRYADILLMKAECIMRGASDPLGDSFEGLINQVRACSGAPSVNVAQEGANPANGLSPQAQVLLDERSRELIYEPWRRNDLIRFGQFEADWGMKNKYTVWDTADHYTANPVEGVDYHWEVRQDEKNDGFTDIKDPRRRLMPLHRQELEANRNWQQNPGYKGL